MKEPATTFTFSLPTDLRNKFSEKCKKESAGTYFPISMAGMLRKLVTEWVEK